MDTAATATLAAVLFSVLAVVPALEGVTPAIEPTRASCTEEQVHKCRQAAEDDTLKSLEGGGSCSAQRYVHYTHACTVSDYRPHIDFCCCAASVKVLCCRYQQSWDRFRCSEAEDTIHTLCDKRTEKGESVCIDASVSGSGDTSANPDVLSDSAPKRPPLYILLPCVLGPLAILGCCIYCCVRHCRYCHNDDDEEIKWGCSCWSPEKKKNDPAHGYQFQNSHSESEPLNSLPASLLVDGKRPLDHLEGARMMPTAPALDDSADEAYASGHCHHHHPHHRVHHYTGPSSISKQQPHSHHSDRAGYSDHHSSGFGRQASVVSAPGGMYSRPEAGGGNLPPPQAPCTGGCGYIRQESAPCGPVAPSYSAHHHVMPVPSSVNMPSTVIPPPTALPAVHDEPGEDAALPVAAAGEGVEAAAALPGPPSQPQSQPQTQPQQPPNPYGAVPAHMHLNINGPRGAPCPSCSTTACAPPTYDESLQHQVLHQ